MPAGIYERTSDIRAKQSAAMRGRRHALGVLHKKAAPTVQAMRDDIIWAAGIFEGEGYCNRAGLKTGGTERVVVSQKGRWLPDKLRSLFGGAVHGPYPTALYHWTINGPRARGFLMSIYGLLSPRRQAQVVQAMKWGTMPC